MIERIVEILYVLSSGLLSPTLVLLIFMMAVTMIMWGGLAREAFERQLSLKSWRRFVQDLRAEQVDVDHFFELSVIGYPRRIQQQIRHLTHRRHIVAKCLEDVELDIANRLSRLSFGTRLGPMLGLVGTLVPLGPALTGLASGDIQKLSGNLVIAFTTTVFGILIGGFAYAAGIIRRGWYEQDLSDLEFVAGFWDSPESKPRHLSANGRQAPCSNHVPHPTGMTVNA